MVFLKLCINIGTSHLNKNTHVSLIWVWLRLGADNRGIGHMCSLMLIGDPVNFKILTLYNFMLN